ncbi:hypothetical protein PAECIP111893_04254 [Paenibacillus plantiphilus]|uniref:WD40-like Beta Propeller Repeat n=2 Tax=Paenibacillus plantiphilus TaxID=2905650 RepID=A0ABM9CKV9_9BACL|nr:hypothetical protein PAECIP111893_04254 [Paenibacillus plantiphilus]
MIGILGATIAIAGCAGGETHPYSAKERLEKPVIFADGIVSRTDTQEFAGTFTPDGKTFFFARYDDRSRPIITSFKTEYKDGKWSEPERFALSNPDKDIVVTSISQDGTKMLLAIRMDKDGQKSGNSSIWMAKKEGDDWGGLEYVEALNSSAQDGSAVWTNSGVYFMSTREGASLYKAEYKDGKFEEPVKLDGSINEEGIISDVYVDPEESVMLFTKLITGPAVAQNGELFISYRKNGVWTKAERIVDPVISTSAMEEAAFLSPDGQYVFFTRYTGRGYDIYQVDRSSFPLK